MSEVLCSRVTGTSATGATMVFAAGGGTGHWPAYPKRLGEHRADGRWETLCQTPALWRVGDRFACHACLPAVADEVARGQSSVQLERIR